MECIYQRFCTVNIPYMQLATELPLDIFSLPDAFLRKLMRKMDIKDRLRLRLTCRSFQRLVEDTQAGYVNKGFIYSYSDRALQRNFTSIRIGDRTFRHFPSSGIELEQFINFRNRLFDGIPFGEFIFQLNDSSADLKFIRAFIRKFKIETLIFDLQPGAHLESALQLISGFPSSKYTIPLEMLYKLLASHKNICLEHVPLLINSDEWIAIMQAISAATSYRSIQFSLPSSTIVKCLSGYGITESKIAPESCGKFVIIDSIAMAPQTCGRLRIRYDNCFVTIEGLRWTAAQSPTGLIMCAHPSSLGELSAEKALDQSAPLYSHGCGVCFTESPSQRSFFIGCGHSLCRACAEQLALDAALLNSLPCCPYCRTMSEVRTLIDDLGTDYNEFMTSLRENRKKSITVNTITADSPEHRDLLILEYLNGGIDSSTFCRTYFTSLQNESQQRGKAALEDEVLRFFDDLPKSERNRRKFPEEAAFVVWKREKQLLIEHLRREDEKSSSSEQKHLTACLNCPVTSPPFRSVFTACGHIICRSCASNMAGKEEKPLCPYCNKSSPIVDLFEDLIES